MAFQGTVTGNLGRDPQLKYTQAGKAVLDLNIGATPRQKNRQTEQWEDAGESVWVTVSLWEQAAEKVANMQLHKGDHVAVEGTLTVRAFKYEDGTKGASLELLRPRFLGAIPKQMRQANPQTQGAQSAYGSNVQWGQPANDQWASSEPAPF